MKILILLAAALPLWAQLPKPGGGSSGGGGGGGTLTDVTNKGTQGVSLVSGLNGTVAEIFGLASLHPCQTVAINGATFTVDLNIVPANCELQNFGGLLRLTQIHTTDIQGDGTKLPTWTGSATAKRAVAVHSGGGLNQVEWEFDGQNFRYTGTRLSSPMYAWMELSANGEHGSYEYGPDSMAADDCVVRPSTVAASGNLMRATGTTPTMSDGRVCRAMEWFSYTAIANVYTAGMKQSFTADATNAGMRLVPLAGDPSSLEDGDTWVNSSTGKFKFRIGGATQIASIEGHAHAAADVTSGVFAIGRLATGTPDGTKFVRDDGTLAVPTSGLTVSGYYLLNGATYLIPHSLYAATLPVSGEFTDLNTPVESASGGALVLTSAYNATPQLRGRYQALPGGANVLEVAMGIHVLGYDGTICGPGFMESGTGKIAILAMDAGVTGGAPYFSVSRWTDFDTSNGGTTARPFAYNPSMYFVRMEYDGTNVSWKLSGNGTIWSTAYSEAKTASFTTAPDRFIWACGSWNTSGIEAKGILYSWKENP